MKLGRVRRLLNSWSGVAAAALILIGSALYSAVVVSGHVVESDKIKLYSKRDSGGHEHCVLGQARVADGNYNNGFTRATTWHVKIAPTGQPCTYPVFKGPGKIKVRYLYFHKTNDSSWRLCRESNAFTNPVETSGMSVFSDWERKPCGRGGYRTDGRHHATFNQNWKPEGTGPTSSPKHFFR